MGVQAGYLFPGTALGGRWQPVLRLQRQDSDTDVPLNTFNVGLNYLVKGHAINVKLDFAINERLAAGEKASTCRAQTQLLF
jgi:hypothetical protein